MGVRLPAEYQEVEYLESDGLQCIQTDVLPSNSIGFDCTFLTKSRVFPNDYGCIFGGRISSGTRDYQLTTFVGATKGTLRFGPPQVYSAGITTGKLMSASLRNRVFTNAEGTIITLPKYNWLDDAVPIALFLLRSGTSYIQGGFGCRIYVMRFYDGDSLIRDYVPCYRKADSKPGMYDLVTGEFFVNQGTGEFLVGPDVIDSISPWLVARRRALMNVPRLPIEYQEVPFIIGQGAQYIDTGYVLTSGCRVQGKYNLYTKLGSVMALFGARDSNYNNAFAMFNVTGAPRIDYGKTLTTHSFSYSTINDRSIVVFDLNAGIATVNGRTYAFADSLKPFTCPSTAMIFAAHTENTVDTRCPKGEIVYLKITDENGIVVRDMVPCYRKSDVKPGMYDLVGKRFYTNAGRGDFQLPT